MTSDVKAVLNRKKQVFKNKDPEEMRRALRELKDCIREAIDSYRQKLERKLQVNDMREVWKGMKTITGCKTGSAAVEGSIERANEFNTFFNRFDSQDSLQFGYQRKVGVEDAVLCLHQALTHLDRESGAVRILFIDFSSTYNTI